MTRRKNARCRCVGSDGVWRRTRLYAGRAAWILLILPATILSAGMSAELSILEARGVLVHGGALNRSPRIGA